MRDGHAVPPACLAFYRDVLNVLNSHSLPYLVGGAYALNHFAGIARDTGDFDIFIIRSDYERISQALNEAGYRTELIYPHWLGKVYANGDVIDLVFNSGNAVARVDESWFHFSVPAEIFGIQARMCPPEETLWSKAYIMERERFDGADVAHLLRAQGRKLDWQRLLHRFGPDWRLLLSHLALFGFIYPADRDSVPSWVMDELMDRLREETHSPPPRSKLCQGTLLSREQYLEDVGQLGLEDARLMPHGNMSRRDTAKWTEAIKHKFD